MACYLAITHAATKPWQHFYFALRQSRPIRALVLLHFFNMAHYAYQGFVQHRRDRHEDGALWQTGRVRQAMKAEVTAQVAVRIEYCMNGGVAQIVLSELFKPGRRNLRPVGRRGRIEELRFTIRHPAPHERRIEAAGRVADRGEMGQRKVNCNEIIGRHPGGVDASMPAGEGAVRQHLLHLFTDPLLELIYSVDFFRALHQAIVRNHAAFPFIVPALLH